jgi:hypothetical protein
MQAVRVYAGWNRGSRLRGYVPGNKPVLCAEVALRPTELALESAGHGSLHAATGMADFSGLLPPYRPSPIVVWEGIALRRRT